jgi:hypothetical protein
MELPRNWQPVVGDLVSGFAHELAKETAAGHMLFGLKTEAVATSQGTDLDVLFRVLDGSNRYAVVHLTWSKSADRPPFPWAEVYASYEDFVLHSQEPV